MVMTVRNQMPTFYCLDILFKYRMFDYACQYLFYRREFDVLLTLVRFEYNENKKQTEAYKQKVTRLSD